MNDQTNVELDSMDVLAVTADVSAPIARHDLAASRGRAAPVERRARWTHVVLPALWPRRNT